MLSSLGLPAWFRHAFFLSIILMFVFVLSLLLAVVNLGLEMEVFLRAVL